MKNLLDNKQAAWLLIAVLAMLIIAPQPVLAADKGTDPNTHSKSKSKKKKKTNPAKHPCQPKGGDPVILSTGDFSYQHTDLFIPGRIPLAVNRGYHSQNKYDGPFGYGWNYDYNITLIRTEESTGQIDPAQSASIKKTKIIIRQGDGVRLEFTRRGGSGSFTPPPGSFSTLTEDTSHYTLRTKYGEEQRFTKADGQLTQAIDRYGNSLSFAYNAANHKLESVSDDAGRSLMFTYTAAGKIKSITDPAGRFFSYAYDAANNLTGFTDAAGQTSAYAYDLEHRLISITDPKGNPRIVNIYDDEDNVIAQEYDGGTVYYTYDTELHKTTVTDQLGIVSEYSMNDAGNLIKVVEDVGGLAVTSSRIYNDDMLLVQETDPEGNTTKYSYDAKGNMVKVTDALDKSVLYTYDPATEMIESITDPYNRTTTFLYDTKGNLLKKTGSGGDFVRFSYGTNGDLLTITDLGGLTTTYSYDNVGNLLSVSTPSSSWYPAGNIVSFTYDSIGNITSFTDSNNNTSYFAYSLLNQQLELTDAEGNTFSTTYDANGNLKSITDSNGSTHRFLHNENDHLAALTDHVGNTMTFSFNTRGELIAYTDAENHTTSMDVDALGRIVRIRDAMLGETLYSYDNNGNLISTTDPGNKTVSFVYDALNRLKKITHPDNSYEELSYDFLGNILSFRDREGALITSMYDDKYHEYQTSYPDGSIETNNFNSSGRVASFVAPNATINYQFDELGRLRSSTQGTDVVNYEYDLAGNRTKLIYPDGYFLTYTYDKINRVKEIRDSNGHVFASYIYQNSRRSRVDYGNGVQALYEYDQNNLLTEKRNQLSSNLSQLSNFAYSYDQVGTRKSKTTSSGVHTYAHDPLYRITSVTYPDLSTTSFNLDPVGNRLSTTMGGTTTNYTANILNQYSQVDATPFAYDPNGNLTSDGVRTYSYDYHNRLTHVQDSSEIIDYAYDPVGRRISKTVNGTATYYVYDGDHLIIEKDSAGVVLARYIYGPNVDEILAMVRGGSTYYFTSDAQGTISELSDATGNVVESYKYSLFGLPRFYDNSGTQILASQVGNDYLFTGRRYEKETGLYFYRARYYSPQSGRFTSPDPLSYYTGPNLYTYADNNPADYIDPMGLEFERDNELLGALSTLLSKQKSTATAEKGLSSLSKQQGVFRSAARAEGLKELANARKAAKVSSGLGHTVTAINIAAAAHGEYKAVKDSSAAAQAGSVAVTQAVLSRIPPAAVAQIGSDALDAGLSTVGIKEAKAMEVCNQTGRVIAVITSDDPCAGRNYFKRVRKGELGSVVKELNKDGEFWASGKVLEKMSVLWR